MKLLFKSVMSDLNSKAKNYCYLLLKYRPRSIKEITDRLSAKKYPQDVIYQTIAKLKEENLLNDREFARMWIESRRQVKYLGKKALFLELKIKGIDEEIIYDLFSNIDDQEEIDLARNFAQKISRQLGALNDLKTKNKFFMRLKRRGFSFSIINAVINEIYYEN
ncbi:MAG: regulatory protein RecX [Candidatus Omnitrophota bacterium]